MHYINTEIDAVRVEIDGKEYEIAPKTAAVAEQLIAVQAKQLGRPQYHLWRAELEILLGKDACRELFTLGKNENLDRMERIHAGVVQAFEHNHDMLSGEHVDAISAAIAAAVAPLNELLRRVETAEKQPSGSANVIRRP